MSPPSHTGYVNGFPELPREPPTFPELPEDAEPVELVRAYASVLLTLIPFWRQNVQAIEWLYGAVMGAKSEAEAARKEIARRTSDSMRPPSASTLDEATNVSIEVAREYERQVKDPTTPPPNGTSVAAMVEERVAMALQRERERSRLVELEAHEAERARLAAEADAERRRVLVQASEDGRRLALERAQARLKIRAAIALAAVGAASAVVEHFLR